MLKYLISFLLLLLNGIDLSASKTDWAVQLDNKAQITTRDMVIDSNGFSYSTGVFRDSLFINTVNGPDTLIDTRFGETFILKTDSCGNVIWAKQFFGTTVTDPYSIALNSQGQIIVVGRFSGATDFDPSSNVFLVSPAGGSAIYITMLDNDGTFIKMGRLGGSPTMFSSNIAIDELDNIYINVAFSGGFSNEAVDFDPSLTETFLVKPTNGMDAVILKLNPQGDFSWVYHIRGAGFQIIAGDITVNGSVISAAFHFFGQIIFDTNTGTQTLLSRQSKYDGLILNLNTSKQFIGYSQLRGTDNITTKSIQASGVNSTFLSGYFTDSLTVPSKGTTIALASTGSHDAYASRWSINGSLQWIKHFSSKKATQIWSSDVAKNGNIYLSGTFQDTLNIGEGISSAQLISNGKNSMFIVGLDTNGTIVSTEQIDLESNLQSYIAIDSKDNIYAFSNIKEAILETYDGDTLFNTSGNESILIFKRSNEPNRIDLGEDRTICDEDSILLSPNLIAADQVIWNTGETSSSIFVKQAGIYHIKVSNCGRVFRDTIEISTITRPTVALGMDTTFCEKVDFLIEPLTTNANKFLWNTNDTTEKLQVNKAGEYILKVENSPNCFAMDTIVIEVLPNPRIFSSKDTVLCNQEELTLDAGNLGSSYLWNNGEESQQITVNKNGVYSVEVTNQLCSAKDSIEVSFLEESACVPRVRIPNVFTPNNDGLNDFFVIELNAIDKVALRVYNSWGQLVFQSNSKGDHWNGKKQGQRMPEGNYFYVLHYSYSEWNSTEVIQKHRKGVVSLLR